LRIVWLPGGLLAMNFFDAVANCYGGEIDDRHGLAIAHKRETATNLKSP
jgi:hypothetical protein